MKILLLTTQRISLIGGAGGASLQLYYLVAQLQKNHKVRICSPFPADIISSNISNVKYLNPATMNYDDVDIDLNLLYSALEDNFIPDIIFYHDIYTYNFARILKHKYNVKTVFIFSLSIGFSEKAVSDFYDNPTLQRSINYITQEIESCNFADTVIVNSDWYKSYFPEFKNVKIIPNCIDVENINLVEKTPFLNTDKPIFGFMQRLMANKGINELLNLNFPTDRAEMVIMGSSSNHNLDLVVKNVCEQKKYHYLGIISGERRFALAKNFDFMLYPNLFEPFCISILECLACGCIPIYTDIPGMGKLFGDIECGIKIKVEKGYFLTNIKNAINEALNLTLEQKRQFRENALKILDNYNDIEKINFEYEKIFSF
jgi:glycosyltransferase involved in cell wall biosynthesis